jgi:hypothetical protein
MLQFRSTLAPTEDLPPRTGFVGVASAPPIDPALQRLSLSRGHFLSARIGISLQEYRSSRSARPLRQTSARKEAETFRKRPERQANEPWAAASFNPEM